MSIAFIIIIINTTITVRGQLITLKDACILYSYFSKGMYTIIEVSIICSLLFLRPSSMRHGTFNLAINDDRSFLGKFYTPVNDLSIESIGTIYCTVQKNNNLNASLNSLNYLCVS